MNVKSRDYLYINYLKKLLKAIYTKQYKKSKIPKMDVAITKQKLICFYNGN